MLWQFLKQQYSYKNKTVAPSLVRWLYLVLEYAPFSKSRQEAYLQLPQTSAMELFREKS